MDQVIPFTLISKDLLENDNLEIQPWRVVWLLTMIPVGISNPKEIGRQAAMQAEWQGYSVRVSWPGLELDFMDFNSCSALAGRMSLDKCVNFLSLFHLKKDGVSNS